MTPLDAAWAVLKYEGGHFTRPLGISEARFSEEEKRPFSSSLMNFYDRLYEQEERAALEEAVRQTGAMPPGYKSDMHIIPAFMRDEPPPMVGQARSAGEIKPYMPLGPFVPHMVKE